MAESSEKLAKSLEILEAFQKEGRTCLRARDLSRTHRERLQNAGFIQEVMKGWYIITRPDEKPGDSTAWYTSFWGFCHEYLTERFGADWCLSPEQSLLLQSGNWTVPRQLLVRAPAGSNRRTDLQHDTAILDVRLPLPAAADQAIMEGLRIYTIEAALVAVGEGFFQNNPVDARAVLSTQREASALLARLLDGGHTIVAGRLAGAFRNIGAERLAEDILSTMRAAGHVVRETDPFTGRLEGYRYTREPSPYVHRIRAMWGKMRSDVLGRFPAPPERELSIGSYLDAVDKIYVTDAYHSLSIEGYRVTRDLIERVRSGGWNPEQNEADRNHRDAMAARGYFQAFEAVKKSLERILEGKNPGTVVDEEHPAWYRQMFGPSVEAGLIPATSLAGYRSWPVYIRGSQHRPLNPEAVRDTMPVFFELLQGESDPAVRIVLGHFTFVYIHPYMDGNGRMGRFIMNTMIAAAGYDWLVIPVERRAGYMQALEAASAGQDIIPFTEFLADLIRRPAAT